MQQSTVIDVTSKQIREIFLETEKRQIYLQIETNGVFVEQSPEPCATQPALSLHVAQRLRVKQSVVEHNEPGCGRRWAGIGLG